MLPPAEDTASPTPARTILERGATIDRFVIVGLVGRGGMGEVYAAYDPELDRKIAIKVLRNRSAGGGDGLDARTRLLREAQAIAKLSHPNVVVVFDVGTVGNRVFLAMEFVEGHTLGYWMHVRPRSWREIRAVFLAAGRGLAAAHAAGIVHRDFKPENVMVTDDGQVRVMDFGLARQIDGKGDDDLPRDRRTGEAQAREAPAALLATPEPERDPEETALVTGGRSTSATLTTSERYLSVKLTQTGARLGTPAYMAPEQFAALAGDARTDQFSFCVALYEALYGERPFEGNSFVALMTNVTTGALRDPPPRTRVPGWIRKVLRRGLQSDPAARYPSMDALLTALETDPTVRARRALAGVAALACLGTVAVGARRMALSHEAPCQGGVQHLSGIWEPREASSARKLAIHRAFAATGRGYAEQAFAGASRLLTEYASRWLGQYEDACLATQVRGEQSAEVLDLRMSCLQERLTGLRALSDVFASADGAVVDNAVSAAGALPALDRCADVPLLKAVVPPPEDEATREQVKGLRGNLARLDSLREAGHCADAARLAEVLVPKVRRLGYLPLLAETLNATSRLPDMGCTEEGIAVARLREAYTAALASRHDEAAAEAAARLSNFLVGNFIYEPVEAREWAAISRAMNSRIGGRPIYESWVLQVDAIIARREGHMEESLAAYRKAGALREQALGPEHLEVTRLISNLALSLMAAGRYEEARVQLANAVARGERLLGPGHPTLATWLNNEGEVLNLLHRYPEAQVAFQRALDSWRRAGSDPFFIAYELTGLGIAYLGEGRATDAIPPLEEALRIRIEKKVDPEHMGEVRFALARALWTRPESRQRARTLVRQALADYALVKSPDGPVPDIAAWLRAQSIEL